VKGPDIKEGELSILNLQHWEQEHKTEQHDNTRGTGSSRALCPSANEKFEGGQTTARLGPMTTKSLSVGRDINIMVSFIQFVSLNAMVQEMGRTTVMGTGV